MISGFTLVRNAQILDFPFEESVRSVISLCDEFVINCGDSDDDTRLICEKLKNEFPSKIKILESRWEQKNQNGGYQLKAQTDAALKACKGNWLLYIQADEVLHESDHDRILNAMKQADRIPEAEGLVFDYLHFYGNYSYLCQGRNWYRREVRAFKNGRGIESFRDAQGFRRDGNKIKALPSGARVFHYGYVRTLDGFQKKVREMSQWWGESPTRPARSLQIYRPFGLVAFPGTHPQVMSEKVKLNKYLVDPSQCKRRWTRRELKNALTLLWEKWVPFRIGEYRNYQLISELGE